jgi:hypothetical protein
MSGREASLHTPLGRMTPARPSRRSADPPDHSEDAMIPIRRNLVPFDIPRNFLRESLPFDLFNNHGVLVLPRGSRLDEPTRIARLEAMHLYRVDRESANAALTPAEDLSALAARYAVITSPDRKINPAELASISDDIHRLVMDHPAMCLGMIRHLQMASQARCHALFVATLGCLIASNMGLDVPTQRTLIRAALSMNLSSFSLQDELNCEARLPNVDECEQLWVHPWQSAELLFRAGVRDVDWLNAIRQHHENLDRSGYPYKIGTEVLMPEARILRVIDVFAAMIGQRRNRTGYAPRQAMRLAFERERGHLDDSVMLTLRRVIGKYPPGTLVKLANRETAVVTRWFKNADAPKFVVSLLRPSGDPMAQPRVRNTNLHGFGIREHTCLPLTPPALDWPRIWAQG